MNRTAGTADDQPGVVRNGRMHGSRLTMQLVFPDGAVEELDLNVSDNRMEGVSREPGSDRVKARIPVSRQR